jgi:hypothetical protein
MFYCNDCAKKNGYPESLCKSIGQCELCGEHKVCNDRPSSSLPKPKEPEDLFSKFAGTSLFPKENIDKFNKMQEIEKIAWQVFLSNTGLRFKRELTLEEKKSITDVDNYAFYRDQAVKIYEKRQRSLLNKKYPVIEIPADGKSGMAGGAYCLCFVYSKYKGNFVLKGYVREVQEYLKKNYTHYFYNLSLWHYGQNRDIWYFWKDDVGVFDVSIKERKKGKKTQVRPYSDSVLTEEELETKTFKFRRLPKRWIPEFDQL